VTRVLSGNCFQVKRATTTTETLRAAPLSGYRSSPMVFSNQSLLNAMVSREFRCRSLNANMWKAAACELSFAHEVGFSFCTWLHELVYGLRANDNNNNLGM